MPRDEQLAWSHITPYPTTYFHRESKSYVVYWQGIAMTRAQALMLVQAVWVNAYPSPHQRNSAFFYFRKAYLAGAFGDVQWNLNFYTAETHFAVLMNWFHKDTRNILELVKTHDIKQAMEWFVDVNEI